MPKYYATLVLKTQLLLVGQNATASFLTIMTRSYVWYVYRHGETVVARTHDPFLLSKRVIDMKYKGTEANRRLMLRDKHDFFIQEEISIAKAIMDVAPETTYPDALRQAAIILERRRYSLFSLD